MAIQLWEADISPAAACASGASGIEASARRGTAALSLVPNVDGPLAAMAGHELDDRRAVLFDGQSQERRVAKVRAKLLGKVVAGSSTRMHFDISDDGGARLFEGPLDVLLCNP